MDDIQEILVEYIRMRNNDLDAETAWYALRPYVERLTKGRQGRLIMRVQQWEHSKGQTGAPVKAHEPHREGIIRPLRPKHESLDSVKAATVKCPNCGKLNLTTEAICFACGEILDPKRSTAQTRKFSDVDEVSGAFFTQNSVMVLRAQDSRQPLHIYPQNLEHELIIGRSTEDSAIIPDIDLAEVGAGKLGVSRLHLALYYDHDTNTVCVHDLGSTNGSFVNGQKLHPHVVRVLYDGDELRLGKLSLRVYFQHQGKT